MRNRLLYFIFVVVIIAVGISSRKFGYILPKIIADYSGDILWALMVFCLVGFLFPKISTMKIAVIVLLFSFAIESSQLYHAGWIDNIRHTILGSLILGYGFLWSDLICYTLGILIGATFEFIWRKRQ